MSEKNRQKWTDKEIEVLKEHYSTMPRKKLQETYFPNRSIASIAQKAKLIGLAKTFTPWTDDENDILIRNWTQLTKARLLHMLPGRTWGQCRNQVNKLKREGQWQSTERRNYAAIEPEEQKRRSEFYNTSLRYKMGLGCSTSVKSFQNNKVSKNNKTGVRGVSKNKNGKFTAYIRFQGKLIHLGTFPSLEDAKIAREDAMKELQPEINKIALEILKDEKAAEEKATGGPVASRQKAKN